MATRTDNGAVPTVVGGLALLLMTLGALLACAAPAGAALLRVDPVRGSDSSSGTRTAPLRTLSAAWNRLPATVAEPTVIELAPGNYRGKSPVYWENHSGRAGAPIVIRSADRRRQALLPAVNLFGIAHLEFRDLRFRDGGDVVHCEQCDDFTLRGVTATGRGAQETVKINQSRRVRILSSRISGAGDNAIDFVAVTDGLIRNNVVSRAVDWCAYAKGGSANIRVLANVFQRCGTGGFTAGQGTGFQFMAAPWLQYEAVGVVIANNTVTDTEGAAFGVQGGFNVLVRDNVALRVGRRSHVLEATYGGRSCDGHPGDPGRERCAQHLSAGGWGTTVVDDGTNFVRIGNRHVYFVSNVILNPAPYHSRWQQLEVPADFGLQPGSNVPDGVSAASDLRFLGNVIWNGGAELPLGADGGCTASNPSCNDAQLARENRINWQKPALRRRGAGLARSGWVRTWRPYAVPPPQWGDLPAGTPPWRDWPRGG
jgi:hypothetical protein